MPTSPALSISSREIEDLKIRLMSARLSARWPMIVRVETPTDARINAQHFAEELDNNIKKMFSASPAVRRRCLANCSKVPSYTISQLTRNPAKHSQWHLQNSLSTSAHLSSEQPSSAPSPKNEKQIIFSGIQPTGIPHLGNYLGALREWVLLQNSTKPDTTTLLYSIVDLHALTLPQDPEVLRTWRRQSFATLLAVGLDPTRCRIFYQSAVCR